MSTAHLDNLPQPPTLPECTTSEKAFYDHMQTKPDGKFKLFVSKALKSKPKPSSTPPTTTSTTRSAPQLSEADFEAMMEAQTIPPEPEQARSLKPSSSKMTDEERAMYSSERLDNFRWLSKVVGRTSDVPLSKQDLVSPDVSSMISDIGLPSPSVLALFELILPIGQLCEAVYSDIEVETLMTHYPSLVEAGLLKEFHLLGECDFVEKVWGKKTSLLAFVAYRRTTRQLIVSISGSTLPVHGLQNIKASRRPWKPSTACPAPARPRREPKSKEDSDSSCSPSSSSDDDSTGSEAEEYGGVHTGFHQLYKDIRIDLEKAIRKGLETYQVDELVITGHSMGGAVSYLLTMDLLSPHPPGEASNSAVKVPNKICLVTFGTPRVGDLALVKHYHKLVETYKAGGEFREYSVKAYNDGACLL